MICPMNWKSSLVEEELENLSPGKNPHQRSKNICYARALWNKNVWLLELQRYLQLVGAIYFCSGAIGGFSEIKARIGNCFFKTIFFVEGKKENITKERFEQLENGNQGVFLEYLLVLSLILCVLFWRIIL